jgi:hypothetical protein
MKSILINWMKKMIIDINFKYTTHSLMPIAYQNNPKGYFKLKNDCIKK